MKLYVTFKKPKTVIEFLKQFYNNNVISYNAVKAYPHSTYYDKRCTLLQSRHTRRSFDDLFSLITTYYPSISEKKLLHYLLILKIENKYKKKEYFKPYFGYCLDSGILKYIPYSYTHITCYGDILCDKRCQNSKHSIKSLMLLLNIKTKTEFLEYIAKHTK